MRQAARIERIEKRRLRRVLPEEAHGVARVRRAVEAVGFGKDVFAHAPRCSTQGGGLRGIKSRG